MSEFNGSLEVEVCCRCLAAPARWIGGHVTRGPHIITAGWCEGCRDELHGSNCTRFVALAIHALGERLDRSVRGFLDSSCMGWCGHWVPEMGLRVRGSPSKAAVRAAHREQRIEDARPAPREALRMHFEMATQAPSSTPTGGSSLSDRGES